MSRCVITLVAVLALVGHGAGRLLSNDEVEPVTKPSADLVEKLTRAILTHCPKAEITMTDEGFFAKDGTMIFTVHGRNMDGQVHRETHEEEGPNYKGFVLRVSLHEGSFAGQQAVVPQTLQGPYYPTFIDAVSTPEGKKYHRVSFAYGSRLDPKLKQVILETIPKTKLAKPTPKE